jgi:hypothetical protein
MTKYVLDRSVTKRPCIYKQVGNTLYPIMYLQKAKNVTNEEFDNLVKYLISEKK